MPLRLDLAEPRVDLAPLAAALAEGACAVIPTDTVYGLVCDAGQPEACARLSALKRPDPGQASTVMFASQAAAESLLAPLDAALAERARAVLARGATVLVPNPQRRYLHLTGSEPQRIGLRVSAFPAALAAVIARRGRSSHVGQPARRPRSAHAGRCPRRARGGLRRARRRGAGDRRSRLDGARPECRSTRHPARGGARHGGRARAHRLMPPRREST